MNSELETLVYKIDEFISIFISSTNIKTLTLIALHNIFILLCIIYLFIGKINQLYYVVIGIMVLILLLNYRYKGCPLIHLERKYLQTNKWYGSYHVLELFGINPSKSNIKQLFIIWILIIGMIPLYRLYNNK